MKAIILISHGHLAKGLKHSVEMIAGKQDSLFTASLMPEDGPEDLQIEIEGVMQGLDQYEEIFIFTDLFGGSPSNTAFMTGVRDSRVEFISGMNFPLVLTAVLTPNVTVESLLLEAKEGIIDIKSEMKEVSLDEED